MKKTILITGANGNLGTFMATHLHEYLKNKYKLILTDIKLLEYKTNNIFIKADISKIKSLEHIFDKYKINIVLHLAGNNSKETPWKQLLPNNVVGMYNIFQIASKFKCDRVVWSSSINSVNNYPEGITIKDNFLPHPKSLYGSTKVFGEAIAKLYATEHDLSCVCIRFGRVVDRNDERISLKHKKEEPFPSCDRLITFEDATQLVAKSIEAKKLLKFFIAHGLSDNKEKRLDIKETKRVLGYKPEDDAFLLAN